MKKLKIGLLGMGRIGRLHGDNITYFVKNAEIVAAGDPMLNDAMKTWAAELGIPKVYNDPMKVIQDPEVEAVFIRAPYIERAGKGVEALATYAGKIVAVRQGRILATAFHPELTDDLRLHEYFIGMAKR